MLMNRNTMLFHQFAFIAALVIVQICDGKVQIFQINENLTGNLTKRTVIICSICSPGFQPSRLCTAQEKTSVKFVLPSDNVVVSSCERCPNGSFSHWYSALMPCRKCFSCLQYGMKTRRNCTAVQDSLCEDQRLQQRNLSHTTPEKLPLSATRATATTKSNIEVKSQKNLYLSLTVIIVCSLVSALLFIGFIGYCVCLNPNISAKKKGLLRHVNKGKPLGDNDIIEIEKEYCCEYEIEHEDHYVSAGACNYMGNKQENTPIKSSGNAEIIYYIKAPVVHIHNEPLNKELDVCFDEAKDAIARSDVEINQHSLQAINCTENPIEKFFEEDTFEERKDSGLASSVDSLDAILLETGARIGPDGGQLKIKGTSVVINVPSGAITGHEREIYAKVYLGPPNDHEQLSSAGHTIALPQLEMGPSGMQFDCPVEVVMNNSSLESKDNIEFEFADGRYNKHTVWKKALRANSKEEAKLMAINHEPHVSFFVGDGETYAYYMHFTLARILLKKAKKKWLQGAVFSDTHARDASNGSLKLAVVLYEPTEEGRTILEHSLVGMQKVALEKTLKVVHGEPINVIIKSLTGNWHLQQGYSKQEASLEPFFHPKLLGQLTIVDFIIANEQNPRGSFTCSFDLFQENSSDRIDLKVKINSNQPPRHLPSASSGYNSDDSANITEVCSIDDKEFSKEDEYRYMLKVIVQLSDFVGAHYQRLCRHLGIEPHVIDACRKDYEQRDGCKEVCYQLLRIWLQSKDNDKVGSFKEKLVNELRAAVEKCKLTYVIHFPTVGRISKETTV